MKDLPKSPDNYFAKFDTDPVLIKPFDIRSRTIADEYLTRLKDLFAGLGVELSHRGSTAFAIAGKGDIEIGVYPPEETWVEALQRLEGAYGKAGNIEENYVRFNDVNGDYDVEIIVLKGNEAKVDKRLTVYLKGHPKLLKDYEEEKKKHAYSKREYQRAKDRFLRSVVKMIPEE